MSKTKNGNGIAALFARYAELSATIRDLEAEKKLLTQQLTANIPENTEKAGVFHKVTIGKSVSYSKVVEDLKVLIPKTKHGEIEIIKSNHTKEYPKHTFTTV